MIKFSAFTFDHRLKSFEFEDPASISEAAREEIMTPERRGFFDSSLFFDMECGDHRIQGEFERSTFLKAADAAYDFILWAEAFRNCRNERSRLHSPQIRIDSWISETGQYTKRMVSDVDCHDDEAVCSFEVLVTKESVNGNCEMKDCSDNAPLDIPVVGINNDELFGKILLSINREVHPGSRIGAEQLFL